MSSKTQNTNVIIAVHFIPLFLLNCQSFVIYFSEI